MRRTSAAGRENLLLGGIHSDPGARLPTFVAEAGRWITSPTLHDLLPALGPPTLSLRPEDALDDFDAAGDRKNAVARRRAMGRFSDAGPGPFTYEDLMGPPQDLDDLRLGLDPWLMDVI